MDNKSLLVLLMLSCVTVNPIHVYQITSEYMEYKVDTNVTHSDAIEVPVTILCVWSMGLQDLTQEELQNLERRVTTAVTINEIRKKE